MLRALLAVCLCIPVVSAQQAKASPTDLVELLDKGLANMVLVEVTMNKVVVAVELTKMPSSISVPAGSLFVSGNPKYQDLIVVENLLFSMPLTGQEKLLLTVPTCCTDRRKASPVGRDYTLRPLPKDDELRKFAEELAGSGKTIQDKQIDVWRLREKLRREGK